MDITTIFINLILQICSLNVRNTKKAISVISNAKYNEHTLPLFKELNLQDTRVHLGEFMYKVIHDQLPHPLIPQNTEIHRYSTRQVNNNTHIKHRKIAIALLQINYKGPAYWKDILNEIQQSKSLKFLTGKLKRNILNRY